MRHEQSQDSKGLFLVRVGKDKQAEEKRKIQSDHVTALVTDMNRGHIITLTSSLSLCFLHAT